MVSRLAPKTRKIIGGKRKKKIELLETNISDMPCDQKSPQPPVEGVLQRHRQTHKQTDGHCNFMTESAQWADSVIL